MSFPLSIVIWDYNPERIAEIDRNLHLALRELNLRGTVSSLSEPPLMSREGLVGREPVLEIGDAYCSFWASAPCSSARRTRSTSARSPSPAKWVR